MARCWIGDKPLSELMLTWSTDALGGDELMLNRCVDCGNWYLLAYATLQLQRLLKFNPPMKLYKLHLKLESEYQRSWCLATEGVFEGIMLTRFTWFMKNFPYPAFKGLNLEIMKGSDNSINQCGSCSSWWTHQTRLYSSLLDWKKMHSFDDYSYIYWVHILLMLLL